MIEITDFPKLFKGCGILQPNGDGGDMAQRTSFFHVGRFGRQPITYFDDYHELYTDFLKLIYVGDGLIIRCPLEASWANPSDIPGDQFDPVMISAGLYDDDAYAKRVVRAMYWGQMKRLGFYPNGNLQKINTISAQFRALHLWMLWPLIFAFDSLAVLGALLACAVAKSKQDQDGNWWDMDNALTCIRQAELRYPTPLSWLTRKIYVWFYPQIKFKGTLDVTKNLPPLLAAVAHKHYPAHSNPQFAALWFDIILGWYKQPEGTPKYE